MNRQMVIHMDVPVEVGGVICHPGDLIFADGDGLCVVPQPIEAEAIQAAWDKVHAENEVREAIKGGMKAVEAYHHYGVL
jgi:regulator of RNase E activity RraA